MTQSRIRTKTKQVDLRPVYWSLGVLALIVSCLLASILKAEEETTVSHGYSFYGDLKYPADYKHFDYVNPDAPKGGEISRHFVGTLDSMNPYSGKGRAHLFSIFGFESLFGEAPSQDGAPADTYGESYCLLCETVEYPKDRSWALFRMRPEARFSDGTPVTAHDVMFSHNLLLDEGLKSYADAVRKRIPKVEVLDDHTIKFYFADEISRRSLIEIVGGVTVWSKDWFEKTGNSFDDLWLDKPPGSGAYVVDDLDLSKRITLKRNPDYWGKDLPFNVGRHNFDIIRLEIFGDDVAAFEAFKAGEYTFRQETDSKKWAKGYVFPKVRSGDVVTDNLPDGSPPSSSGIIFNLGKPVLQDRRVREALTLVYNFEWTNESLQNSLFQQRNSFTQNSPLMATGKPEGVELALLESLGDLVPAEMLNAPALVAHTSNPKSLSDRRNRAKAGALLKEAGWNVINGIRRNASGETLKLNFLMNSASSATGTAVMENYVSNVKKLGVDITLEKVDSAQYTSRERDRDYHLVFDAYPAFLGTGTGLTQYFGSEAAEFSLFNPAGLASPLVDALIDASLDATSRVDEYAAITALDRALRYERFMIPLWYNPSHWVAYYDQYEHPEEIPPYGLGYLDFWWYNADKAQALRASGALR